MTITAYRPKKEKWNYIIVRTLDYMRSSIILSFDGNTEKKM